MNPQHHFPRSVRKRIKHLQSWKLTYCARKPSTRALWMVATVLTLVVYLVPGAPRMSATFSSRGLLFAHNTGQSNSTTHHDNDSQASFDDGTNPATADHEQSTKHVPSPPKACLAMIMKNEGPILPRLFTSVSGFVSEYCVVDTGSTDNTIEVLKSIDMPGILVEEPFVNFAVTRNFLLDTCRAKTDCDYLVLLDADMVLKVSPEWDWTKLDAKDVYDLVQVSSIEYNNVRIVRRMADKIKVVGATHEYYNVPSEYTHGRLPKRLIYIDDVGDGKAKGDKFERDERLLRAELEREPDNVRTVFYLANTLKDQGKYAEAIPFYKRRATMGGWYAEADYSLYMLSTCYLELGDLDNARTYAEQAAFRGWYRRAEPLYFLAFYFHRHENYELAWYYATLGSGISKPDVSTALFINFAIYEYWLDYERASLCRHVFPSGSLHCLQVAYAFLANPHAPQHLREYLVRDLHWHAQRVAARRAHRAPLDGDDHDKVTDQTSRMPASLWLEFGEQGQGVLACVGFTHGALRGDSWVDGSIFKGSDPVKFQLLGSAGISLNGNAAVLLGTSANGSKLFRATWPVRTQPAVLTMTSYDVNLPSNFYLLGTAGPWPLFQASGLQEVTYCITQWYPTIEVARVDFDENTSTARLQHVHTSSGDVPRAFSFYSHVVSSGVQWRDAIWFMVEWSGVDDAKKLHSVVMLDGHSFNLRAATYPFMLESETNDASPGTTQPEGFYEAFDIMEKDGEEVLIVACALKEPGAQAVPQVREIPLKQLWAVVV